MRPIVDVPEAARVVAFGPDLEPVVTVADGGRVRFTTTDACGGAVVREEDVVSLEGVGDPVSGGNPASGPVAIAGAEPGDSLIVDIESIDLGSRGFVNAFPGVGPLAARVPRERTWFWEIDGTTARRGGLEVPLRPMIGVIGVATGGAVVANDFPGPHGGNLDNRLLGPGARIYLPVRQPGAQLALGDVHAAMGDGELSGSGLEVSAAVVARFGTLPGRQAGWPIVETAERWYVHGAGADWDEAVAIACEQAAVQLEHEWGLSPDAVPAYLSLAGDLGVCQAARPGPFPVVVRLGVARSATSPHAFRMPPA